MVNNGYTLLATGPSAQVSVRDHGAVGNGTADDTTAVRDAIDAVPAQGGAVYFPPGTYKLTDSVALRSNLALFGDGDGATVLHQSATGEDLFAGVALDKVSLHGLSLTGPGSGTGTGLNLTRGGNAAVPFISVRDVSVGGFGQDGIAVENAVASVFDRVQVVNCGRYGVNLHGQPAGAAGTSVTLNSVYGNTNGVAGIRLFNMVYCCLNGCASDGNPVAYLIDSCQSLALNGCGAESNAVGLRVVGGYGATVNSMWVYDNQGTGIHVTGTAHTVSLTGCTDNTPGGSAANFIKVDAGSSAALLNCSNDSPNSLAAGTTNTVSDGSGGADFRDYTVLRVGGESDGDLTCYTASKGFVLTDRTSGTQFRLKVTSGVLAVEAV